MDAVGVCMHKILRIVYGMLKHNKPFDPHIDRSNRRKSVQMKTKSSGKNRQRRFQDYDAKAPVTKRQRKKRLERERSHSVVDTKSGITAPVPLANIIEQILPEL